MTSMVRMGDKTRAKKDNIHSFKQEKINAKNVTLQRLSFYLRNKKRINLFVKSNTDPSCFSMCKQTHVPVPYNLELIIQMHSFYWFFTFLQIKYNKYHSFLSNIRSFFPSHCLLRNKSHN
jgi:hypothetical protein